MPGKHRNGRESRTWFYFPYAVTKSPMNHRRRTKSVSIKNICLRTIGDASAVHHRYFPIIWKHAYEYMKPALSKEKASSIVFEYSNIRMLFGYSKFEYFSETYSNI